MKNFDTINDHLATIKALAGEIRRLAAEDNKAVSNLHLSDFLLFEFIERRSSSMLCILLNDACGIDHLRARYAALAANAKRLGQA